MKDLEKALKEKLIENGASSDWLDKHLEVVDYTDSKPSNKPIILPSEIWVELYSELSAYIENKCYPDRITHDQNGKGQKNQKMIFVKLLMK